MIKVTIHIENCIEYMDEDVCKDVKLQCLPRIGDTFWVDTETEKTFCDTIHEKNLYERYGKWLYGKSGYLSCGQIRSCSKTTLRKDFDLTDAVLVKNILFKENGEIHIELSDNVQTT